MIQSGNEKGPGPEKQLYYLENATITQTNINVENRTFTGCIYDQSGKIVTASQRTSRNVAWKPLDPNHLPNARVENEIMDGHCIYLGHYTGHYGHFLLETLSRFWIFREKIKYDRVVFQPFIHTSPHPRSFSPARICFECFQLTPDQILIVNKQTMFKHLVVPTALVEINNQANEEQALIYRQIAEHCEQSLIKNGGLFRKVFQPGLHKNSERSKLYLSRKKLKSNHYMINEGEIEKLFTSFGFTIVYPENLTFQEQVVLYKNAEVLAGFSGSALHNSVFMKDNALVISLGDLRRPNGRHPNQIICDKLSGVRSVFIKFEGIVIDQKLKTGKFNTSYLRHQLELSLQSVNTR